MAGLFKLGRPEARRIVLTVTGHGLKDPDTALTTGTYRPLEVEAEIDATDAQGTAPLPETSLGLHPQLAAIEVFGAAAYLAQQTDAAAGPA